jgi:hypothetical protein
LSFIFNVQSDACGLLASRFSRERAIGTTTLLRCTTLLASFTIKSRVLARKVTGPPTGLAAPTSMFNKYIEPNQERQPILFFVSTPVLPRHRALMESVLSFMSRGQVRQTSISELFHIDIVVFRP